MCRTFRDVAEHAGSFRDAERSVSVRKTARTLNYCLVIVADIMRQRYEANQSKKKIKQRRSDNECYCKKNIMQETTKESQYFYPSTTSLMDHSSVHSLQSRRIIEEVENSREKTIDRRSTTIDFDIESPDKQRFKTNNLESPLLSPDTQSAIENAEKILEEVQHKITEVTWLYTKTETKRRVKKKERYTDYLEPPLEDEKEEALYIHELVSSKLKEIDHGENESNSERDEILTKKIMKKRDKRIARLLEPKFRIAKRYSNDILYRQRNRYCCIPYEQVEFNNPKCTTTKKDEIIKDDRVDDNKRKIKSLTIQNGPPLNIARELMKQNLGYVNISPDTSFVHNNSNVNIYKFRHKSCINDKSSKDSNINESRMEETIDEIDESSIKNRLINKKFRIEKKQNRIEKDIITQYKSVSKDEDDSYSKDLIDERRNDLSSEREINSGREENKDGENVSKHLPRTGVDCFLSNGEPSSSSTYSDHIKNLIPEHREIIIKSVNPYVNTDIKKFIKEDEIKDTSKSHDVDDNNDHDDVGDENVNNYRQRIDRNLSETSFDNIKEIEEDNIKILKKNKKTDCEKTFKMFQKHDLRRDQKKKLYNKIDERFENIFQKYNLRNNSSYKLKDESRNVLDNSMQDSDNSIFNEIELNPPSIENFNDIFFLYDKMIERISKSEKKLEEMLEEFQLKLSVQSHNTKLPNNTDVTYCNLIALKSDNTKLMKLNPSKLVYKHQENDESTLSLSDEAVVISEEDKLQKNSSIINDHSSLTNKFCNLREETSKVHTYSLEQKQNDKLSNKIFTLDKSNLCSIELNVENIPDVEKKTLEICSNNKNIMACVPLSTNYHSNNIDCLEDLRRNDESNQTSFNNEELLLPKASKCLLKRQDQFVDHLSFEKKNSFERSIVNSLSNVEYNPLMVQELIRHLQLFSNVYNHDIPTILQKFFVDTINRESDLILDLLSIQKHDYENEKSCSVKAFVQDNECKVHDDVISNTNSFDDITYNPMQCKQKSFEICPLNTMEIEDTKSSINELNQNEIQVLEKSTQYDISHEQDILECEDRIIKDIYFDKKNGKQISDTKSEIDKYSTKQKQENYSNDTKLHFTINDNTNKNDKSSDINMVVSNLHLLTKVIDKLSEGEDCSNLSDVNINIPVTHIATISSETSHSEGELYLPSSCSYSLGEIRVMKNSAATCNRALVSNNTLTSLCDTTSLLHYSSGEVSVDNTDIL
ncbi:MATH and LRR domain-containing protein PFE0570w-like isoform X1 [Vespa crabro]|uniref:MATH and LRR domain-containing protein PFE0570w-like isoform X1 n=2 Tax=Vespa crabro TaxID=7445 RepID=UPI001F0142F0|nr:MATH and LRR domain-containing protein PFE0570w-like isoform X1 [Vespa crabro]